MLPVLVNGLAGGLVVNEGRVSAVLGFSVLGGRILEIDVFTDSDRLGRLGLDRVLRANGLS